MYVLVFQESNVSLQRVSVNIYWNCVIYASLSHMIKMDILSKHIYRSFFQFLSRSIPSLQVNILKIYSLMMVSIITYVTLFCYQSFIEYHFEDTKVIMENTCNRRNTNVSQLWSYIYMLWKTNCASNCIAIGLNMWHCIFKQSTHFIPMMIPLVKVRNEVILKYADSFPKCSNCAFFVLWYERKYPIMINRLCDKLRLNHSNIRLFLVILQPVN